MGAPEVLVLLVLLAILTAVPVLIRKSGRKAAAKFRDGGGAT